MFGLKTKFTKILDLQEVDKRLDKVNHSLVNIVEKSEFDSLQEKIKEIAAKKAIVDKQQSQQNLKLDKLNGELDMLVQKIKKEEQKLFGGTIGNPKELSAIQQEIESLNRKRDQIETEVLEQMDKVSALEEVLEKAKRLIENNKAQAETAKAAWQKRQAELEEKKANLTSERNKVAGEIDERWLAEYNDVKERKGGIGAATLIKGICQVCRVELPETDLEKILAKEEPDFCTSCGRLLVTLDVKSKT